MAPLAGMRGKSLRSSFRASRILGTALPAGCRSRDRAPSAVHPGSAYALRTARCAEGYPPTGRAARRAAGKDNEEAGERGRPWRSALSRLMKGDSEWGKRLHRLVEGGPAAMSFQGRCIPHVQYMVQISKTPFPPESPCSPHSFWRAAREYPVRRDICSCTGCSAGSPQSFSSLPVLRV